MARRIKIVQPDSPFFEVNPTKTPSSESLKQSKIAAGMEVSYIVRFMPKDVRDYSWDLHVCTERETFIIPIRALGLSPKVSFPDEIRFGNSTVGVESREMILLKNTGNAAARFTLTSFDSSIFTCPPEEQVIEPGMNSTIEIYFVPKANLTYSSEIKIEFKKGTSCYIRVTGNGQNVDITISSTHLSLEPTFISLRSQKTFRIFNRSKFPINFRWKSFAALASDECERSRLLDEIDKMESAELASYRGSLLPSSSSSNEHKSDSFIAEESNTDVGFEVVAQEAQIVRKYRNLRTALSKDFLPFVDNIFEITPLEGQVWAASELEQTVTFSPDTACLFETYAYLEVTGREDRLPLRLNGTGVGAHAVLSFDTLDIGDIFVNTEYFYEVTLQNRGEIPAAWSYIQSSTLLGSKFSLIPNEGVLAIGDSEAISIRFESDTLGDMMETLRFALQGKEDPISCRVKGSILGPSFHFDCLKVDFGVVSFDYLHQSSLRLVNTSTISMVYLLHIPMDGEQIKKEFDINPAEGTLGPGEFVDITIDFIPSAVRVYNYTLNVDVLGVGESLHSIPLLAECIAGSLKIHQKELVFGESFIRFPYLRNLTLTNTSSVVRTKYEILPQLQYTTSIAVYEPEAAVGFIEPNGTVDVMIRLVAQKIGSFRIAVAVAILGSTDPPLQVSLSCSSIGPRLVIDKPELRWGNIDCLTDCVKPLQIKNDSLISAPIKMFAKLARSKFSLSLVEKTLLPQESVQLDIVCNLDDSVLHKDELYIVVEEGDHIMIPLSANGVGTTLQSTDRVDHIDMGVHLTNTAFERKFVLENRGRRPQKLHWVNKTLRDAALARTNQQRRGTTSKDSGAKLSGNTSLSESKFNIEPVDITLRPNTATTFTIRGFCLNAGRFRETLVLESIIGKEREVKEIISAVVSVEVMNPLIDFSCREVSFDYKWKREEEVRALTEDVTITNRSLLNLNFVLKTESPFNLSSFEHLLLPSQSVDITIEFYPWYRNDHILHNVNSLLTVAYRGHPQREIIPLKGSIHFPNLDFDKKAIDFGCVLNDTLKYVTLRVMNVGILSAAYEWSILEPPTTKNSRLAKGRLLDILPFRSVLLPGASEEVRFSMLGAPNQKIASMAVCTVEGGPEYKIPLTGEASAVSFALKDSSVDFGQVLFNEVGERVITIQNTGKVPFPFEFQYTQLSSIGIVEACPSFGTVSPGDKSLVTLRVYPVVPSTFTETLVIKIAHFDPVLFTCSCKSIFPALYINLPRNKRVGPFGESGSSRTLTQLWENIYDTALKYLGVEGDLASFESPSKDRSPTSESTSEPPTLLLLEDGMAGLNLVPDTVNAVQKASLIALDVEIQRIVFCHHIHTALTSRLTTSTQSDTLAKSNSQTLVRKSVNLKHTVTACYYLDFGNVISGQSRKRVVKIINATATGYMSWTLDHKDLAGTGFTIDPEKVAKVPELASIELLVRFTARKKLGRRDIIIPLELKNAPAIHLILSANVCLPDVELSSDTIHFDRLLVGYSQKVFVKLSNNSPVSARWSLKKPAKEDASRFTFLPVEGTLAPGKSCFLSIEFVPTEGRKFISERSVIIDTNSKVSTLKLIGEGYFSSVNLSPLSVQLGPVLPFARGTDQVVTISNTGVEEIVIYSLDKDSQYTIDEERLLAREDIFDADGYYRWDISQPNAFSIENLPKKEESEAISDASPDNSYKLAPLRVSTTSPRDDHSQSDYLILGPSLSGVTTLARSLAIQFRLPLRTLDEIVQEISKTCGDFGALARRILNTSSDTESRTLAVREEQLKRAAVESQQLAAELWKKKARGKDKEKEVPAEALSTPEATEYLKFLAGGKMNAATISKFVGHRLQWEDMGYGVVIDGLKSAYTEPATVLAGLHAALCDVKVVPMSISAGAEGYRARLSSLQQLLLADEDAAKRAMERTSALVKKPQESGRSPKKRTDRAIEKTGDKADGLLKVSDLVPPLVPSGEEPWLDLATGRVIEQDMHDFRLFDSDCKTAYLTQFRSQIRSDLEELRGILARIPLIQTALIEDITPGEESSGAGLHHELLYSAYVNEILPSISELFKGKTEIPELMIVASDDQVTAFNKLLDVVPSPYLAAPDPNATPARKTFQLIRRPSHRPAQPALLNFTIVNPSSMDAEEVLPMMIVKSKDGHPKSAGKLRPASATMGMAGEPATVRWRIAPGESATFKVRHTSTMIKVYQESFRFEVAGTRQQLILPCSAVCDVPKISADPRHVFTKRIRALSPGAPLPSKRFVLNEDFYSFGNIVRYTLLIMVFILYPFNVSVCTRSPAYL